MNVALTGTAPNNRSLVFASQVRVPFEAGEVLQAKTSSNSYLFRVLRVRIPSIFVGFLYLLSVSLWSVLNYVDKCRQGSCRVEMSSMDSPPRTVALLGPGSLFGESSLFHQKEHRPYATVIAESDGEVEVAAAPYLREL